MHPCLFTFWPVTLWYILQQDYYPPVPEGLKIAKRCTEDFFFFGKSKMYYDWNYVEPKFEVRDLVIFESQYPNTRKLSQVFSCPYQVLNKLSGAIFEIDK